MIRQNLHAHTVYCDGKHTALEMAEAAIDAGLDSLGISGHSPMPFDDDWSMKREALHAYRQAVRTAAAQTQGRLRVYLGIEWDAVSDIDLAPYDYVIGSVHYMPCAGGRITVDGSAAETRSWIQTAFAGDRDAAAAAYFDAVGGLAERPEVDIAGHIDLLTKFDETDGLFTPYSRAYRQAAERAAERLVKAGKIIEVNTGAMARGYRTTPYPDRELLCALREMGGRICITADAHHAQQVAYGYDRALQLVKDCGYDRIWVLTAPKHFEAQAIEN